MIRLCRFNALGAKSALTMLVAASASTFALGCPSAPESAPEAEQTPSEPSDAGSAVTGTTDAGAVDGGVELPGATIRGRFESMGLIRSCHEIKSWKAPDGPLLAVAMNLCQDSMADLADTLLANLDKAAAQNQKALVIIQQGINLPAAWLSRCQKYSVNSGRFVGETCVPWDPNYQEDLRNALSVVATKLKGHAALAGVYFTISTMTNGGEMHWRVNKASFVSAVQTYPGDTGFLEAYTRVMDTYQQLFDVPIVFEAGHCIWSGTDPDCLTPRQLYRHSRDTYGVANSGLALWNCAERFWAGTGAGAETFGAKALIEEASQDGASIGCQTVGSFVNGACRFSDDDVGDYGTPLEGGTGPETKCAPSATLNPALACVDTMNWFAGRIPKASITAKIKGTWAESWSGEFGPTGPYTTSPECKAAIDLLERR